MSKRKQIQPKPTLYAGVQFRSRLEARWAVFFDNQKNVLNWTYEPTTITTKQEGWKYTPDFLIAMYIQGKYSQFYLECKPTDICHNTYKELKLASKSFNLPLILLINPMFGEEAKTIKYVMFLQGETYGFELTDLFPDHGKAVDIALAYRFDLKD